MQYTTRTAEWMEFDTDLGKFRLHCTGLIEVWYNGRWENLDGYVQDDTKITPPDPPISP